MLRLNLNVPQEDDAFTGIDETYEDPLQARLYSAYVDLFKVISGGRLRAGRQRLFRDEGLNFDGVFVEKKLSKKILADIFLGIPVHKYESTVGRDTIGGLGVKWRMHRRLWARMDFVRSTDEFKDSDTINVDDIVFLSFGWKPSKYEKVFARFSWIRPHIIGEETQARRHSLKYMVKVPHKGISGRLVVVVQPVTLGDFTTEFADFFGVARELRPYSQVSAYLMKEFSDHVAIGAGVDARKLERSSDEGMVNRDFLRPYVDLNLSDVLARGGEFEFTLESWNTGSRDILTWDASYSQKLGKKIKLTLGRYYEAFEYDVMVLVEEVDVESTYVKLRYNMTKSFSIRSKFEYTSASGTEFTRFQLGLNLIF